MASWLGRSITGESIRSKRTRAWASPRWTAEAALRTWAFATASPGQSRALRLPCCRRRLCRLPGWNRVLPRNDVRDLGQVRDLAAGGVSYVDAGVIEQQ